jgi:hypothetical protein
MLFRRTISILFAALLVSACGNCGGNNDNNGGNADAGNNQADGGTYADDDSVASLSETARRAVCEDAIAASGEPGEEIDCDGTTVTLPAISDCADDLAAQPECVTVKTYSDCFGRVAACDAEVYDDPACYFLTHDACAPVTDDTSVADLSAGQTREICTDLVGAVEGGPGEKECSATEIREVPNVDECVAKVETIQPCATVGMLRGCFEDYAACQSVDRDECWFWLGDDGGCTAPYAGFERRPSTISVFPPVPESCDMPGPRQRIPFVIGTTDVFPLVPGDIVNGLPIIPGQTFDTGSLAVRRSRVSELTTLPCTSDLDCSDGFKCAASGVVGATRYCTRQNPVTFVPGTMQHDVEPGVTEDQKQVVGVLIENTALLEGRLPTASGALFDEEGEKDLLEDDARASDPTRSHREMLKDFLIHLASVADPTNSRVTIFWYAGQVSAEARPLINPMELQDHFTNDLSVGEALIDSMPTPVPKPANLFQGMQAMMDKDFGLDKYADHEKFLYIFTDGPNEVYDEMATYDAVLQQAQALGVRVFIVHLDAEIDPTLIRDVPTYWAGNDNCQDDPQCTGAPACATDADCRNFETCRPATVYAEMENDPVTETPVSYCMPQYNDEGRLGPIDYFADMACRTGGNYMYVTAPEQMRGYWNSLAATTNGQFSVVGDFAALESSDFPGGFYRQAGVFLGIVGTSDLGAELSAPVESFDVDNRAIIRLDR